MMVPTMHLTTSGVVDVVPENCPLKKDSDLSNRKRVSKACLECKKRHCRCDHQRPCGRCAKLGLECVDAPTCKRGPPKGTSYKKRKRQDDSNDLSSKKKSSSSKKTKNIKNVQIKVEPGPYVTTTVATLEPSAKRRRIDSCTTAPSIAVTTTTDNMTSLVQEYNDSYLSNAYNRKQEMLESPTAVLFNTSVDSIITPTFLETPKLEQANQFTYTELPDIEDLTVGLCMNTSCGANFNHHCMINELDTATTPSLEMIQNLFTTPTAESAPQSTLPLLLLNDTTQVSTSFDLDVFNFLGTPTTYSSTIPQQEEDFLIS